MSEGLRRPHSRCKCCDASNPAHYLTFSCYRRRPLLADEALSRWLCDALGAARSKVAFDLWAWVAMPEHAHLLVWPREGTSVSEVLRQVKLPVARKALVQIQHGDERLAAQMLHHRNGQRASYRLWQRGGGYDRNIWTAAEVREKIEYIHANPVRRGLVEHPRQWRWSSWHAWHGEGSHEEPVRIDRESVPAL